MTIVYKYFGLSTDRQWSNVQCGLERGGLWFSRFFKQNDPMEGIFWHNNGHLASRITDAKNKYVICSFGSKGNNSSLWSYYADGYRGACVGFRVEDAVFGGLKEPIKYIKQDEYERLVGPRDPDVIAKELITRKLKSWSNEKEIRLLKHDDEGFIDIGKCCSLYFGKNMSMDNVNRLICYVERAGLVESLNRSFKIPVYVTSPTHKSLTRRDRISDIDVLERLCRGYHAWRSPFSLI